MRLEADRMTGLVLDDKVVLPERDVVLEERRMRIDNEPAALLRRAAARRACSCNHSYRNPKIGWEHEIRELGTADALAFYRDWYAPNNAILIIAGDVGAAEVRASRRDAFRRRSRRARCRRACGSRSRRITPRSGSR